jgi:hypothetical protein
VTLLSALDSGSVMPLAELLGPTPTTDGISDFGESSWKLFVWVKTSSGFFFRYYIPVRSPNVVTDGRDRTQEHQSHLHRIKCLRYSSETNKYSKNFRRTSDELFEFSKQHCVERKLNEDRLSTQTFKIRYKHMFFYPKNDKKDCRMLLLSLT